MSVPRVISNQKRNGKTLVYLNYRYHVSKKAPRRIHWRCVDRNCTGTITTNNFLDDNPISILNTGRPHLHESDEAEIVVEEVVQRIKRKARSDPNTRPLQIIREELVTVNNEEVLMRLPERRHLYRNINRIQNAARPRNPMSLSELEIPDPYDKTMGGDQFLQFDSGVDDENRVLIFYAKDDFVKLCNSGIALADGTFKTAPRHFYQMFTIHGVVDGKVYPLVYALTARKTEATYTLIFDKLKEHATQLNLQFSPPHFVCDFELGIINSVTKCFPNSVVHGCHFHLTQSIWRYAVQNCNLKVPYQNDPEVRRSVNYLLAIGFLPLEDVESVFYGEIYENIEDSVLPLWEYVKATYVSGIPARGRRRATPPRFPPHLWNVYLSVLEGIFRTTNHVEGWHSRFQKTILVHHSNIWKFLDYLKAEQRDNEVLMLQVEGGHTRTRHPIKRSIRIDQELVENIVRQYANYKARGEVLRYLTAISYRLKRNVEEELPTPETADD